MKYWYSLDYFHEILIDLCYKLKNSSLINSKNSLRGFCRVSILTCGDNNVIGFTNTYHRDKLDTLSSKMLQELKSMLTEEVTKLEERSSFDQQNSLAKVIKNTKYALNYIHLFKIGVNTTCGYISIYEYKIVIKLLF